MDSVSSVRLVTPSSSTASFDNLSNEIVENICQFLKLQDLGSLLRVDYGRNDALRSRIGDIGLKAVDHDLHALCSSDAANRIRGLADWLGQGHFIGPEANELRVWESLLERAQDARLDTSQQADLSLHLMISIWRRMDVQAVPDEPLTDKFLELFVRTDESHKHNCKDTLLSFENLLTSGLAKSFTLEMANHSQAGAGNGPSGVFEWMLTRRAAVCSVRLKVAVLSSSISDKLKAFLRAETELACIYRLLPKELAVTLVHDLLYAVNSLPFSVQPVITTRMSVFNDLLDKRSAELMKLLLQWGPQPTGQPGRPAQGASCLLM